MYRPRRPRSGRGFRCGGRSAATKNSARPRAGARSVARYPCPPGAVGERGRRGWASTSSEGIMQHVGDGLADGDVTVDGRPLRAVHVRPVPPDVPRRRNPGVRRLRHRRVHGALRRRRRAHPADAARDPSRTGGRRADHRRGGVRIGQDARAAPRGIRYAGDPLDGAHGSFARRAVRRPRDGGGPRRGGGVRQPQRGRGVRIANAPDLGGADRLVECDTCRDHSGCGRTADATTWATDHYNRTGHVAFTRRACARFAKNLSSGPGTTNGAAADVGGAVSADG